MQSSYLCPMYSKWLMLHPEQARIERQLIREQALTKQFEGDLSGATTLTGQVYEISKAVLLSPREPELNSQQASNDLLAYAAASIHLSKLHKHWRDTKAAQLVLHETHCQLNGLLPLYASEGNLLKLIKGILQALSEQLPAKASAYMH